MELYAQKRPEIGTEIDVKLFYMNQLDSMAGGVEFELPIEDL